MQIEKITENKIRIILSIKDLQEKNIDLHSFMSNSIESQDLFFYMLDKAEKEVGFKTKDYKLMIEALAIPNGNFILTITRIVPEKDIKQKLIAKRKISKTPSNLSIYMFNTFEEYLDFCTSIQNSKNNTYNYLKTTLYLYKSKYYLCLYIDEETINDFKLLHYLLVEFSTYLNNVDLFERKLKEYGKIVFAQNAINNSIKHFK